MDEIKRNALCIKFTKIFKLSEEGNVISFDLENS